MTNQTDTRIDFDTRKLTKPSIISNSFGRNHLIVIKARRFDDWFGIHKSHVKSLRDFTARNFVSRVQSSKKGKHSGNLLVSGLGPPDIWQDAFSSGYRSMYP
jgi:hypothetical protein